MLSSAPPIR